MSRPTLNLPETSLSRFDARRLGLVGLTALTAYATAIGWQAQLVSYPLYRAVGPDDFAAYHQQYNQAIPWVVIVPGFLSFLAGMAFPWTRPADVPRGLAVLVGGAGAVSIATTVLWAIPMHDRLDEIGPSAATIDSLIQANTVRTVAMSAATVALVYAAWRSGRR